MHRSIAISKAATKWSAKGMSWEGREVWRDGASTPSLSGRRIFITAARICCSEVRRRHREGLGRKPTSLPTFRPLVGEQDRMRHNEYGDASHQPTVRRWQAIEFGRQFLNGTGSRKRCYDCLRGTRDGSTWFDLKRTSNTPDRVDAEDRPRLIGCISARWSAGTRGHGK